MHNRGLAGRSPPNNHVTFLSNSGTGGAKFTTSIALSEEATQLLAAARPFRHTVMAHILYSRVRLRCSV